MTSTLVQKQSLNGSALVFSTRTRKGVWSAFQLPISAHFGHGRWARREGRGLDVTLSALLYYHEVDQSRHGV